MFGDPEPEAPSSSSEEGPREGAGTDLGQSFAPTPPSLPSYLASLLPSYPDSPLPLLPLLLHLLSPLPLPLLPFLFCSSLLSLLLLTSTPSSPSSLVLISRALSVWSQSPQSRNQSGRNRLAEAGLASYITCTPAPSTAPRAPSVTVGICP